jgi:hypothetical protein
MKTIPGNGVGGYDNTMQDLMANLSGSTVYIMLKNFFAGKCITASGNPNQPAEA